ncbi:MAG: TlpA disulfide reductase family protein [Planctomycetota bacterium]
MRRLATATRYLAAVGCAAVLPAQQAAPANALRERAEAAAADGLSGVELEALAEEALALAERGGARRQFWTALTLAAELCAAGPPPQARGVRARALALLARRPTDAMRWSTLLTRGFLPPLATLPRAAWAAELAHYETTLATLTEAASSDPVRAELLHARALARLFIDRRWDWLTAAQREETIALLTDLEEHFGTLPVPGTSKPDVDTVGRRAKALGDELARLHFGAPAPRTTGVDLDHRPFDLAQARGDIVVLDFWTSFCQPCLALVPRMRERLAALEGKPVTYLGVCGDTDQSAGRATAQRVGMTWRNLWDGPRGTDGPASTAWGVPALGWPSVFVIDGEGRIRYKLRGARQVEAELDGAVQALLAERRP